MDIILDLTCIEKYRVSYGALASVLVATEKPPRSLFSIYHIKQQVLDGYSLSQKELNSSSSSVES